MILNNPHPKGKWFTVKVKGRPQKIFIQAYGSYDLSKLSNEFNTDNMTQSQIVEKFFAKSKRRPILIPAVNKSILLSINKGKNFYTTSEQEQNIITLRSSYVQPEGNIIISLSDYYFNNQSNINVIYDSQETISTVSLNGELLTQGNQFNAQDWYVSGMLVIGGGKVFVISSIFLSQYLQQDGDSVSLTATFESGQFDNFTINCKQYYQPAVVGTFYAFEISDPGNIIAAISLNEAESLTSITDSNNYELINDTDYSFSENTITIFSGYLQTFFTEDTTQNFVFAFTKGDNSTVSIKAISEFSDGATVLETGDYYYNSPNNANVNYTPVGNISGLLYGETLLQKGVDNLGQYGDWYVPMSIPIGYSQFYVSSNFLSNYLSESGQTITLTMSFYDANPVDFSINSAYLIQSANISSFLGDATNSSWFDVANPENMVGTITWGDTSSILSIVDASSYSLVENTDYTLTGDTLTILSTYLSGIASPPSAISLTVSFNIGDDYQASISTSSGIGGGVRPRF